MRRRSLAVVSASAVLLTGLVGCSSSGTSADGCLNPLKPGVLSNGVELTGITDGVPSVRIAGDTGIMNAQRTVLSPGEDAQLITGGEIVTADVTIFDSVTGETIAPTQTRFLQALPKEIQPDLVDFLAGGSADSLVYTDLIMASVVCAAPGDVLAVATTAGQSVSSQLSVDPVVMVIEVLEAHGAAADGRSRALPFGFPAVTADDTGRPGVVLPPQDAPAEVRIAPAIVGSGAAVAPEDYMIGHVLTVGWDGTERANTWDTGLAEIGSESQPASYDFRPLLTGQTVGSRVVIIDPNDGDPLVHIVDIVAVG